MEKALMTTLEKYTKVFMEVFNVTEEEATGLAYQGIPAWDSVGHMTLIAGLEDAFDIILDTDDIIDLNSFDEGKKRMMKYDVVIE
jgi:acyl carrier protein